MYYTGKFFGKSIDSFENLSNFHIFFISGKKETLLHRKTAGESLEDYLAKKVFADAGSTVLQPDPDGVAGFQAWLARYEAAIPAQRAAEAMK